jgi:hypothetical protein
MCVLLALTVHVFLRRELHRRGQGKEEKKKCEARHGFLLKRNWGSAAPKRCGATISGLKEGEFV